MRSSRLQEVETAETFSVADPPPQTSPIPSDRHLKAALFVREFSDKVMTLVSVVFTLLLAGSAFALTWAAVADPTQLKLMGVGVYYGFILVLEIIRRRRQ